MRSGTDGMHIKEKVLAKIREYDTVLLFRHQRMDGDCVGAAKGLQQILRLSYPEKKVILHDWQRSNYLAFMGPDDGDVPAETYKTALAVVLDTATRDRISNPHWQECREVIKIDHHIETDPYGDLNWVEPERSSVCEMVAEFAASFPEELKLDKRAAECLYAGMVTDSGRFRYPGVTGDTLRLAAGLLDTGIDTETLYANLYLRDRNMFRYESWVYENMRLTEHGAAYVHVPLAVWQGFGLDFEAASDAVGFLDSVRGSILFMALIETGLPDRSVRVRLRSRFMAVDRLAAAFHDGGHANASGGTVYSEAEEAALLAAADDLIRGCRRDHPEWM